MTQLSELRRQKRELIADMKEAGIMRMSCMNRQDNQSFSSNLRLQELTIAIEKAKRTAARPQPEAASLQEDGSRS